jgi:hypothetical protein
MRNTWIDGEQYVLISLNTLFQWWDWLDALENEPEQAFYLFQQFLEACEDTLELHPDFIKYMDSLDRDEFIPLEVNDIDDLFDDLDTYTTNKELDVPFNPRFDF